MPVEAFNIEDAAPARPSVQPARTVTCSRAGLLLGIVVIIFTACRHQSNSPGFASQGGNSHPSPDVQVPQDEARDDTEVKTQKIDDAERHTETQPSRGLPGGWSQVTGPELAPGSHIASLAAYALDAIKGQSNSLEVQNIVFGHVLRASRQIVNGVNSHIVIQLLPQGIANLDIYEQAWNNTLRVLAASYSPSDAARAQVELITRALTIDADGFWGNTSNASTGGTNKVKNQSRNDTEQHNEAQTSKDLPEVLSGNTSNVSTGGMNETTNLTIDRTGNASTGGGWLEVAGRELAFGSYIASLAAYAFDAVKGESNSLEVQNITFGYVLRASRQIVNGINNHIVIQLLPQGTATLDIHEQAWNNTLKLSAASFSPSDVSLVQVKLIKKELTLDADGFWENRTSHTTGITSLFA